MNLINYTLVFNKRIIDYPEEYPSDKKEFMTESLYDKECPMCGSDNLTLYEIDCPALEDYDRIYYEIVCQRCSSSYIFEFKTIKDAEYIKKLYGYKRGEDFTI